MRHTTIALLLLIPALALGATVESLKALLNETTTAKGRFAQTVFDKNHKPLQQSTGTLAFSRPGKFRWEYNKPYEQTIVGDGTRLWIYDKDLNQVTARKLDRALGATPAALLAGGGALENNFTLTDGGTRDGLEYVEAKPKTPDTGFELVRIGLAGNAPKSMELRDTFGNVTTLRFGAFERNVAQDANVFRFTPPKGADIVGEK